MENESWLEFPFKEAMPTDPCGEIKVGILSDTHGWVDPSIRDVLADADRIVHAGDVVGAPVLEDLERLARQKRVVAVAGNNDVGVRGLHGNELPLVAEVSLFGGTLVVTHGDRFGADLTHEKLREAWPEARAIVYGHTHQLVCDQERLPWVLNPGAAGQVWVQKGPSCLMLMVGADGWKVEMHQFELLSEN